MMVAPKVHSWVRLESREGVILIGQVEILDVEPLIGYASVALKGFGHTLYLGERWDVLAYSTEREGVL